MSQLSEPLVLANGKVIKPKGKSVMLTQAPVACPYCKKEIPLGEVHEHEHVLIIPFKREEY